MPIHLRAVYEHGALRLLTPVDLEEGQEVEVTIMPPIDEALIRKVLGNKVRWHDPSDNRHEEVEALAEQLAEELTKGGVSSQLIIDERGER